MKLEIVSKLIHEAGIAREGKDLFVGHMPEAVESGVLLIAPQTGETIDEELPCYRKSRFQIIVRASRREAGIACAKMLMDELTVSNTKLSSGDFIVKMRPRHEPVIYPVSEGDYLEISVNYDAVYNRT